MAPRHVLPAFFLLLLSANVFAQEWKLRVNKSGIRVFSQQVPGSKINALRVEAEFAASASRLVAVIMDINCSADWLYSTKSATLLKTVSPAEVFYYSEVNFPWPASNRDFVAHIKVNQNPSSKVINVHAENVASMVPEKACIVRVKQSVGNWYITPLNRNHIHVLYELQVDPAGDLPAWLVNLLATKGPFESFRKLRTQLERPVYAGAQFNFITD